MFDQHDWIMSEQVRRQQDIQNFDQINEMTNRMPFGRTGVNTSTEPPTDWGALKREATGKERRKAIIIAITSIFLCSLAAIFFLHVIS